MNDVQLSVLLLQGQPEALGPFIRPTTLSFAHLESPKSADSASLDEKGPCRDDQIRVNRPWEGAASHVAYSGSTEPDSMG